MDRNRETRRTTTMAASNGLSRRRHRPSLRDSPDGLVELPETVRLRDRGGSGKKERDRIQVRDRDRDQDRGRLSRSKRRRADRLMHGSNGEEGGDESSEESVNDEDEDDDGGGDHGGGDVTGHMRVLPPMPTGVAPSLSFSFSNSSRRRFPPATTTAAAKVFRPVAPWKAADEMIGVPVPRKARTASTKRSHEWLSTSGYVAVGSSEEQILQQTSTSPVRSSLAVRGASPVRPVSPSSSNASARKKANGPNPRPPKSSSKSSSSDQDEIEIEIAEVLYGMMRQPQVPSLKNEAAGTDLTRFETREESRFSGDAKSQISLPISNSPSAAVPHPSSILPQNSSSSVTPMSAIESAAPKRKKLRPMKYDGENQPILPVRDSPIAAMAKANTDRAAKTEAALPNLDRTRGSAAADNGGTPYDSAAKLVSELELVKPETAVVGPDSRPLEGGGSENREAAAAKEEPKSSPMKESCSHQLKDDRVQSSPKKESFSLRLNDDRVDSMIATKVNGSESQSEEKFQIDLMAPPPSRSYPERDGDINDFASQDPNSFVSRFKREVKLLMKDIKKAMKVYGGEQGENASYGEANASSEFHKEGLYKENIGLQLDLEKNADNGTSAGITTTKLNQAMHKQQQQSHSEKTVQPTNSLTSPLSVAGWPGGLPPMGQMTHLQGVVSMDGSPVAPAAIQAPPWLFNQPRPKKCATHHYIARIIHYHQQFTRMNPFWPAAAGSVSLYGTKPCNLNAVPSAELPARAVTALPEKAQNPVLFLGKDNKPSPTTNSLDPSQRKQQIMLQQTLPPGAPSNILGPAFIFPLSQQHAAAAATAAMVRPGPGTGKAPNHGGISASTSTSTSVSATAASAMSFSYPSMPGNEPQYVAILQNNAYPFPVPAHVGAAPTYCGTHAQAMPFFNVSFYSPQMLQQQAPVPSSQTAQSGHQSSSISSGSTSTQKHLQNQQKQRPLRASIGNGNLQGSPAATKGLPSQQQNQHSSSHHARSHDREVSAEDSPLSADVKVPRSNVNIYGQNFTMPVHTPNFALMSPARMASANSASGNGTSDKKQQQLLGPKATGFDPLHSQAFAMSFGSLNSSSTAPSLDISSIVPNHAILQSLPEVTRHRYQMFTAAATAQMAQQKNYRSSDDGKNGGNDAASEEERKMKGSGNMGHSITFSRQDVMAEAAVSSLPGSNMVDSSARTLNIGSASARSSGSAIPAVVNTFNAPASQQPLQWNKQQQIMQHQKQHQFAAAVEAAARSKAAPATNVRVSSEQQLPPFSSAAASAAASATAGKSLNALSPFQQNLVQSSSPNQSPQWKNYPRATPGVLEVPSSLNSTSSALKNHHQPQQGRPLQGQTQISFAAVNSKGPNPQQIVGQQLPSYNQSPSPPSMVGSPTTSSMSKSTGGSPRTTTTSASMGNKTNQVSTLSTQQAKSSLPSVAGHKSSAGPGAVPSIRGNSHIITSSGGGMKHQLSLQHPMQQQTQLFFTHPCVQVQPSHSTSSSVASATSGYNQGRRNTDSKSLQQQPPQGSSAASSPSGMFSLCSPMSLANSSMCDPVKAAAASSLKGGVLPSQGILHAAQFAAVAQTSVGSHQIVPAGFPYIHAVQNAVQVKAAKQKQPAATLEESR